MKKIISVAAIFFFLGTVYGQKVQNRETDPFDKVIVFGKLEVYLQKGEKTNVKLESDEVDLDDITTRTDKNELKISFTDKLLSSSNKKAKITITYINLQAISANAGSEVNTNDTLKAGKIELESLSGASLYAFIKCDTIDIDVSSGSLVSLEGSTKSLEVEVGSRATYSGYEFKCQQALVKANSGGLAKVKTTEFLDASATTRGTVIYDGEPKMKKVKETLGGKIKKLEE